MVGGKTGRVRAKLFELLESIVDNEVQKRRFDLHAIPKKMGRDISFY